MTVPNLMALSSDIDLEKRIGMEAFSSKVTWAISGVIFGICFPVIAVDVVCNLVPIKLWMFYRPILYFGLLEQPPFFLGVFAFAGGYQNDKVRDFSRELEGLVKKRTYKLNETLGRLASQSRDQESLLSGIPTGIFYFDGDGVISNVRSSALEELLPDSNQCSTFAEFLEVFAQIEQGTTEVVLSYIVLDDSIFTTFQEMTAMLCKEIQLTVEGEERLIALSYLEQFNHENQLERVMVFAEDVTDKIQSQREHDNQVQQNKRISLAVANPERFGKFSDEVSQSFATIIERIAQQHQRFI